MTFQIGMVATDGIILASDRRILNEIGYRISEHTAKIICHSDPNSMYCWSGDESPGDVARRFLDFFTDVTVDSGRTKDEQITEMLRKAADDVWASQYGPRYSTPGSHLSLNNAAGTLLLACRGESRIGLWSMNYGRQISVYPVNDKSHAGDPRSSAVLFAELYYRAHQTIDELILLAAHSVLMAGKLNPTGINGLEIALWRNSESSPQRLSNSEIDELIGLSSDLNEDIHKRISRTVSRTSC